MAPIILAKSPRAPTGPNSPRIGPDTAGEFARVAWGARIPPARRTQPSQTPPDRPPTGIRQQYRVEIGAKSAENRPQMGPNGAENGANPGESGPSDLGRSAKKRRTLTKRRLSATPP